MTRKDKVKYNFERFEKFFVFDENEDFQNKYIRNILYYFTELGSSFVILAILLLLAIFDDFQILLILAPIYIFQLCAVELIKLIFSRKRPHTYTNKSILGVRMISGSFPSGHTSNVFTLAYLLANYYNTDLFYTLLLFFIAGFVAATRIFLGKHYFIDVLAGGILGIILSVIGSFIWIQIYSFIFTQF